MNPGVPASEPISAESPSLIREISGCYVSDGFAVIPGLFDPGEIAEVRDILDGLFDDYGRLPAGHGYDLDRRPGDGGLGNIPAIRDALRLRPRLRDVRGLARAVTWADRLLGRGAEVLWDAAVYKPAGGMSETPWHQDEAVYLLSRLRKPRSLVYFWVALDAVDEANGCIRFVPGSHRGPVLPHGWRNGESGSSTVAEGPIASSRAVSVPLGAGDATVHHPRTLHSSGPNSSEDCRKAWILGVGRPTTPRWLRRLKNRLLAGGPPHGG
jgi:Phytanoyl-CoA dioxygenase (PhyH)